MEVKRKKWSNKFEYFLISFAYTIGIRNLWSFPYLVFNNGGCVFLIPYFIMLLFCGIPLFFFETFLGQFTSRGCLRIFNFGLLFKGVGVSMVVINFFSKIYTATSCAYILLNIYYILKSFSIPSNNDVISSILNKSVINNNSITQNNGFIELISKPIKNSDDLEINWEIFTVNLFVWIIIYLSIKNGLKFLKKVLYFTTICPIFILFILLITALSLPGVLDGVKENFYPNWKKLYNFRVWSDATFHILFSLQIGSGNLINLASFNKFHNNNMRDSLLIPLFNFMVSIIVGFVVFSLLGFITYKTGVSAENYEFGGPIMGFIIYINAADLLPWSKFWIILYLLMLFLFGFSNLCISIGTTISTIMYEIPKMLRKFSFLITLITCSLLWAISIIFTIKSGLHWMAIFYWNCASIQFLLLTIIEVLMANWLYGTTNLCEDLKFMLKRKISCFWWINFALITPTILITILLASTTFPNLELHYYGSNYPNWALKLASLLNYIFLAPIPVYMGYILLYVENGDCFERFCSSLCALIEWGPANKKKKLQWIRQVKLIQIKLKNPNNPHQTAKELIQLTTTI